MTELSTEFLVKQFKGILEEYEDLIEELKLAGRDKDVDAVKHKIRAVKNIAERICIDDLLNK